MNNRASQIDADLDALLDGLIDRFERAKQAGSSVDVADFFPDQQDPSYQPIALELLRVDLQCGWKQGTPTTLPEYIGRFPSILDDNSNLSELAFEEFRTRRLSGQAVDPVEYTRLYSVDTSTWPTVNESTVAARSRQQSTVVAHGGRNERTDIGSFTAGDKFGDFELLHELGRGAFARVFLARQPELAHRRVVLKLTSNTSNVEPNLLAKLQHANIVPIYSVHEQEGSLGVCMPDFGPCTLHDVAKRFHLSERENAVDTLPRSGRDVVEAISVHRQSVLGELDERSESPDKGSFDHLLDRSYVDACVHLMLDVAHGLRHAHDKGIVHCDLKPANILVADHGTAMLLDFNLSGEIDAEQSKRSLVGGTLPYLAPEHLSAIVSGDQIQPTSDIFSFGAILYELLTGQLPFGVSGSSLSPNISQIAERRQISPASIREANPAVPGSLENLVNRLLVATPENRYPSMREVCEDLSNHLDDRPLKHVSNPISEVCKKWRRRHPSLSSATSVGAIATILVVILGAVLLLRTNHLVRVQTASDLQNAQSNLDRVRTLVSIPDADPTFLREAIRLSDESIALFVSQSDESDALKLRRSPASHGPAIYRCLSEHLYLNAKANRKLGVRSGKERELAVRAKVLDDFASSLPKPDGESGDSSIAAAIRKIDALGAAAATEELEALLEVHRYDMSVWLLLANAYADAGRLREADGCYTTCCVMWPDSVVARLQRGACRSKMTLYTEAEQDFTDVLLLRPDFVPALVNRASVRGKTKRYHEALSDLDQAEILGGAPTRTYFMRANFLRSIGQVERANAEEERGLKANPSDANSWIWRGLAHLENDKIEQALADFEKALLLSPHSREAKVNIAYVLAEKQGDIDAAIDLMNQVVDRHQHFEDIAGRGVLLARIGDFEDAIADAKASIAHPQRKPPTIYRAACVFSFASDANPDHAEKAVELLDLAIQLQPDLATIALKDPDLAHIRASSGFKRVVRAGIRILKVQQRMNANAN